MELPPELWARICSFLPSSALKRLYTVNSVFFDLSMSERYREFNMDDHRRFARFRDPFIAKRVRSVLLTPDEIQMEAPRTHSRSLSSKLLSQLVKKKTAAKRPPEEPSLPSVADLISNMSEVDDLTIIWGDSDSGLYEKSALWEWPDPDLIARSLRAFAPRLERLTMQVAPHRLHLVFPLMPVLKLKYLSITIEHGSLKEETLHILLDLLNSLSDTLQVLHIFSVIDLSSLFAGLVVRFSHLHTLNLGLPVTISQPSHLHDFVNLHGDELTTFTCFGNFDVPPILKALDLRYLRRLEIDPRLLLDEWSEPVGLKNLKALTDLSLIARPMRGAQVSQFLHFCASSDCPSLQRLDLSLEDLTSAILETFARSLPSLKYLSFEIMYVVDEKGVFVEPKTYFPLKSDMGRLPVTNSTFEYELKLKSVLDPFRNWELYDISIRRHPYICWGMMNVLAECVPSIRSFCGHDHKEMPREARMWMS